MPLIAPIQNSITEITAGDHHLLAENELARMAQGSLLGYLQLLIDPSGHALSDEEINKLRKNPCVSSTVQLLDAIKVLPESTLSIEEKRGIFKQVSVIARTYPGGVWDGNHTQWSINGRYNPNTKEEEQSLTSPAETLNLVCRALLDKTRYLSLDEKSAERDLAFRIETFYTHMLSLQQQVEAGNLEKCSAGLQHDLLYFLNRTYLDKPKSDKGQPIILLMDTDSFLLETLSLFIEQRLGSHANQSSRTSLVLDWIRWQVDVSSDPEQCPLVHWLRTQFPPKSDNPDSGWKQACKEYTAARCSEFGLNPNYCPIDAFVDMLPSIPIPSNVVTPLAGEVAAIRPLPIQGNPPFPDQSLQQLIDLRNEALRIFRDFRPETEWYKAHSEAVHALYSAAMSVASLHHYQEVTLLIGAEDSEFLRVREALKTFLLPYFSTYTPEAVYSSPEFEKIQTDYKAAERVFLTSSQTDFIANFFALIEDKNQWDASWSRLQAMQSDGAALHSLVLTDETLETWRRTSSSVSEDGTAVLDITPYAINRFLLHGLLVDPAHWTPAYCHYLLLGAEWLSSPSVPGESLALRSLKEAYPHLLLANLVFMATLANSAIPEVFQRCIQRFGGRGAEFNLWCRTNWFDTMLRDPHLTPQEKANILKIMQGRLGLLTQDGNQLAYLYSLKPEDLSENQRAQIWKAVEGRFETLIYNVGQVIQLFSLTPEQLSDDQRKKIWKAIEGKLNTLIKDSYQLVALFSLTPEQLDETQRKQILRALDWRLSTLIESSYQLVDLFSLSPNQLSDDQRTRIWEAVEGQLNVLIRDAGQLMTLFQLPLQKLSEARRTQILTALEGQFDTLIRDKNQLIGLFQLPLQQLTEAQRKQILTALEERVNPLSSELTQLLNELDGRTELLSEVQRQEIQRSVEKRGLGVLVQNIGDLIQLLRIPLQQLSETLRTQILTAIKERFGMLIRNVGELIQLFQLSPQQLSDAQRTQILTASKIRLNLLIQNPEQLIKLFQLPSNQLSETQRIQIWKEVQGKLSKLIKDKEKENALFKQLFPGKSMEEASFSGKNLYGFFEDSSNFQADQNNNEGASSKKLH